jgi:diguanylate cyclase (GGDEF)-like protein
VRRANSLIAVLFLDMDSFKQINDRHGHLVGDQLLRAVAMRLQDAIRASDTVGRLGGDEFVVVLERVTSPECVATIADNLRTALSAPIDLDGTVLQVTPSIGIALYPADGDDGRQLIRCADDAMYVAKSAGGNRIHFRQVASARDS